MPLSNLVTLKDSDRAECGLKIFGIAVGLLILMATVALLSILMTRTVDGQLATIAIEALDLTRSWW